MLEDIEIKDVTDIVCGPVRELYPGQRRKT